MKVIMDCGGVLSIRSFKHYSRVSGPRLGLPAQGHLVEWAAPECYGPPRGSMAESACPAGEAGKQARSPGGKIPWRRTWQPAPLFLPAEPRGRRAWRAAGCGVAKSRTRLSTPGHT